MAAHSELGTASVLSTLQSEVATEASPMLRFLIRHAWLIVICIAFFIAAIAGYWLYSWQDDKQKTVAARELGGILMISDAGQRMSKLENYLASAPQSTRHSALFALLESAEQLRDYPRLYAAWKDIGAIDPGLRVPAGFGMASALGAQNKYKEALGVLDTLSSGASRTNSLVVNSRIIAYAEVAEDYDRALAACDALLGDPQAAAEAVFWTQKRADLERKKAGAAKP